MHGNAEVLKAGEPEKVLSEQEKKQLEDEENMKKERRERFMKQTEEDAKVNFFSLIVMGAVQTSVDTTINIDPSTLV